METRLYLATFKTLAPKSKRSFSNHCKGISSGLLLAGYVRSRGVKMPPPQYCTILGHHIAENIWGLSYIISFCIALFDPPKLGANLIIAQWLITSSYFDNTHAPTPSAHAQPSCIRIIQILAVLDRLDCSLGKGWQPSGWLTTNQFFFGPQTNWGSCWSWQFQHGKLANL